MSNNNISIIVATAENWAIGLNNELLWHISADLKRFKALTTSHTIIMGRKTYESIGRPLPNRRNVIISRNSELKIEGCEVYNTIDSALESTKNEEEVFIIGGAEIYKQTIDIASKIYLTKVMKNYDADAFIPEIDFSNWKETFCEPHLDEELPYLFINYER
ncbi:MAG: dihydrofolate reductase [Rikenellaceae bacterium]